MSENLTEFLYLVTIVTFILALRFLSSPRRARLGNQVGAAGMALAIVVTLAQDLENYKWIALAMLLVGGCFGYSPLHSVMGRSCRSMWSPTHNAFANSTWHSSTIEVDGMATADRHRHGSVPRTSHDTPAD